MRASMNVAVSLRSAPMLLLLATASRLAAATVSATCAHVVRERERTRF